jgi:ABC-type ATPase with predicted acetyltransferase domain
MAASNTVPSNRMLALALSDVLDARKSASSTQEIGEIAKSYGMDSETLQRVARFVNTPSVAPQNVTRVVGKDGEEKTTMVVRTINMHMSNALTSRSF